MDFERNFIEIPIFLKWRQKVKNYLYVNPLVSTGNDVLVHPAEFTGNDEWRGISEICQVCCFRFYFVLFAILARCHFCSLSWLRFLFCAWNFSSMSFFVIFAWCNNYHVSFAFRLFCSIPVLLYVILL